MHAVAIDFETANEQRSSPCSIGLAWINDGVIESVEHHYIRPPGMRFASFNIAFHGIGPEQVEDAEEFPAVLAAIAPRLEGAPSWPTTPPSTSASFAGPATTTA